MNTNLPQTGCWISDLVGHEGDLTMGAQRVLLLLLLLLVAAAIVVTGVACVATPILAQSRDRVATSECALSRDHDTPTILKAAKAGCDLATMRTGDGLGVIHVAALRNDVELVREALRRGTDPNIGTHPTKQSALHLAVRKGHVEAAAVLLASGARVDARAVSGHTALHIATFQRDAEFAKLLLQNRADVNARLGEREDTPLHLACNKHVAKLLIQSGASLNAANAEGCTPLVTILASANLPGNEVDFECVEVARLLIESKADTKLRCHDGYTALHLVCDLGAVVLLREILQTRPDLNARLQWGTTPLHFGAQRGHLEIVRILLSSGADVQVTNKKGQTAEQLAASAGHIRVLELLRAAGSR